MYDNRMHIQIRGPTTIFSWCNSKISRDAFSPEAHEQNVEFSPGCCPPQPQDIAYGTQGPPNERDTNLLGRLVSQMSASQTVYLSQNTHLSKQGLQFEENVVVLVAQEILVVFPGVHYHK